MATTTVQACYNNILSKKITATFGHYVPYKTLAVEKSISGKSNVIIAKEIDAIDRSTVFTDLLKDMTLATEASSGSYYLPIVYGENSITDVQCTKVTDLLS